MSIPFAWVLVIVLWLTHSTQRATHLAEPLNCTESTLFLGGSAGKDKKWYAIHLWQSAKQLDALTDKLAQESLFNTRKQKFLEFISLSSWNFGVARFFAIFLFLWFRLSKSISREILSKIWLTLHDLRFFYLSISTIQIIYKHFS